MPSLLSHQIWSERDHLIREDWQVFVQKHMRVDYLDISRYVMGMFILPDTSRYITQTIQYRYGYVSRMF